MLIIFDLDGTLIDSRLDLAQAVNATRTQWGLASLPNEQIYAYVGNGAPVLVRKAMGNDVSEDQHREALEFFLAFYSEHRLDFTTLYSGVRETLTELKFQHHDLAILTNKPVRISNQIVSDLALADTFFRIYGGNSFDGKKKPDPHGVYELQRESQTSADQTLFVGDSSVDVLTARNAQVLSCGLTYGFQPETLQQEPPDYLLDSFPELLTLLESLPGSVTSKR